MMVTDREQALAENLVQVRMQLGDLWLPVLLLEAFDRQETLLRAIGRELLSIEKSVRFLERHKDASSK